MRTNTWWFLCYRIVTRQYALSIVTRNSLSAIIRAFTLHWYVAANCLRKNFKLKRKTQKLTKIHIIVLFNTDVVFSYKTVIAVSCNRRLKVLSRNREGERDREKMCAWMYNRKIYLSKFKFKYNMYASPDRRLAVLLYERASKSWVYGYP